MICRKCKQEVPDGAYCIMCGTKQEITRGKKRRGNGQGYARKRGNTWQAELGIYKNGTRITLTKGGFKTKKEALEYVPQLAKKRKKDAPTLRDLYEPWAESAMLELSQSKQGAYKIAWARLKQIADIEIAELTIADLQAVIDREAPTHYTARDVKNLLSHLYKRACAQGDVPSNLAQYIIVPKLEEKERQPFNREEINSIWAAYASGDMYACYVLVMIYSGMMPGELLKLEKGMIHWDDREIVGCGIKTKERKTKPILIADAIVPVLETLCDAAEGDKLVTMNRDAFYDAFRDAMTRWGCRKLTPYSCRHTTGTELASDATIPPSIIQRVMRHTKFTTTQRYIHPDSGAARDAVNKIDNGSATYKEPKKPVN